VMKIEAEISDFESTGIRGGKQTEATNIVTGYILVEESTHKIIEYETVDFSLMISGSEIENGTTITFQQLFEHTN
jgi:hypothetical protein